MTQESWYYCLSHKTVEPYEACRAADRLGPYPSRDDATAALTKVRARNEEWDSDPRFNDDVPSDDRPVDVDDDGYDILDEFGR